MSHVFLAVAGLVAIYAIYRYQSQLAPDDSYVSLNKAEGEKAPFNIQKAWMQQRRFVEGVRTI